MLACIRPTIATPLVGALTLTIFLIDALTPLGIAIAVLHGAVIMLAASVWSRRAVIAMTGVCLLLTLVAYGLGHRLDFFGDALGRCIVSLFAIIVIAFLALKGQATTHALRQREEKLREADLRKNEFLAMLAHELRNPLSPISSAGQVLNAVASSRERVEEISDIIIRQTNHMSSLIDDLLDISRVSRGLVSLDKKVVDMNLVVQEAIEQVQPQIDQNAQHFIAHISLNASWVLGDHKRLVQVVSNLLCNASRYTPQAGRVVLWMGRVEDRIVLEVSDTGMGISADLLPHVFDLFSQAERGPDRTQGGLGIGLALVQSIVIMHDGQVEATSPGPQAGSTFKVVLPALEKTEAAPEPLARQADIHLEAGLRLLLVDDNADAIKMLALFLEIAGHHVRIAHSATEALMLAEEETFDAYLIDIGLPEMDGKELARQLRQRYSSAQSLFIAITGYGGEADRQSALEAGFAHYFTKPVEPAKLANVLTDWAVANRSTKF